MDTDYRVLYEDCDLLVVDKPAPLAVHAVGAYAELNLHSLLKKDPRWAQCPIKLVHRLDAETSGVLIITKNYDAARCLGKQFLAGQIEKVYEAVVFGCPEARSGLIDYPLGYDDSSGFQTVRVLDREEGEAAQTHFEVLTTNEIYSRIRLKPRTGRTHQLRSHMALLGCPMVGDKIYVDVNLFARYVKGGLDEEMLSRLKLPRLALHATSIELTHPSTRQKINFQSEPAPLIRDFIRQQGLDGS